MDLGAYEKIPDLQKVADDNSIVIPRLRGYRLMADEERVSEEDIVHYARKNYAVIRDLYTPSKFWTPMRTFKKAYDKRQAKGQARSAYKRTMKQLNTFNKYVGRDDVLMVHARIGHSNWYEYGGVANIGLMPWFIEKVDDGFDDTYCDIYVKIKRNEG